MTSFLRLLRLNAGKTVGERVSRLCLALLIVVLTLPGAAIAQTPNSETGDGYPVAGVVVDAGDAEPIYAVVAFDDISMNAIDLLREADLEVVTVEFGGLGEGVCEIAETGCDPSACRRRLCQTGDPESPFWQLWQQGDDGQWSSSVLGGGQTGIENGDIVAWIWTGVKPNLEPLAWGDMARNAGAPGDIVKEEPADRPGVWKSSWIPSSDDETPSITNMLLSTSVLVLIAGVGVVLARRRRPHRSGFS